MFFFVCVIILLCSNNAHIKKGTTLVSCTTLKNNIIHIYINLNLDVFYK